MNLIYVCVLLLMSTSASAGDWSYLRPQLGLGYSDNVYQDDLNKHSDWFSWLQLQGKYKLSDADITGKFGLNLYAKEDSNNSLNYSLKHKSPAGFFNKTELILGAGGFSYFKSDVGSTDQAYNHFYLTASLLKNWLTHGSMDFYVEPGVKLSSYPQLSGRLDVILFGKTDMLWQINRESSLNPYFELGFVMSNQSYYDRTYVDLGVAFNHEIESDLKLAADLFLRNSSYPGRKVSDILVVSNRRGRSTSASVDLNESISLIQLSASLTKSENGHDFSAGFNYSNQTSLSHLEYYRELQILAWWQTDI